MKTKLSLSKVWLDRVSSSGWRPLVALMPSLATFICAVSVSAASIVQQAYLKASNTEAGDGFSHFFALAVDGDTLVVGAPFESSDANGANGDQADNSAAGAGAAYVFMRQETNWVQHAYLKASNSDKSDNFGYSVSVSGDTIVVGAPYEASNATGVEGNEADNSAVWSGAAYVFVRRGTNWSQQAYLKASNTERSDKFGEAVAVSGDTIVVGASDEDSSATGINGEQANNSASGSGAAYVFTRTGTNWSQQAYLKASNTERGDEFGLSVAVSGDTAVVGARSERSNATGVNGDQMNNLAGSSGAAYVFIRTGTSWSQQAYLKASNTGITDFFGYRVAISGDTVVVSANFESSNATGVNGDESDNSAPSSGAAYVFVRDGTNWSQQAYLKASNPAPYAFFGDSVAVSGDVVVVSASEEASSATGVNGNQTDTNAVRAGAAYVFVRSGRNWSQQAYLKASNTEAGDRFGRSVASSGDTVAVGAWQEDSHAIGANGDQGSNSATNSGAAYVFVGLGTELTGAIAKHHDGGYVIQCRGVPGFIYGLHRAANVSGSWSNLAVQAAPPSGDVEFHDASPLSGQGFYRITRQ